LIFEFLNKNMYFSKSLKNCIKLLFFKTENLVLSETIHILRKHINHSRLATLNIIFVNVANFFPIFTKFDPENFK
jgi:hypothetical protein